MELSQENVELVLAETREKLGSVFGYTEENRAVGITGTVDLVGLDGASVVVRLSGRFWHQRSVVLARVGSAIAGRIPETMETRIKDESQLIDDGNEKVGGGDSYTADGNAAPW